MIFPRPVGLYAHKQTKVTPCSQIPFDLNAAYASKLTTLLQPPDSVNTSAPRASTASLATPLQAAHALPEISNCTGYAHNAVLKLPQDANEFQHLLSVTAAPSLHLAQGARLHTPEVLLNLGDILLIFLQRLGHGVGLLREVGYEVGGVLAAAGARGVGGPDSLRVVLGGKLEVVDGAERQFGVLGITFNQALHVCDGFGVFFERSFNIVQFAEHEVCIVRNVCELGAVGWENGVDIVLLLHVCLDAEIDLFDCLLEVLV
jgi:hypothetical protein